MTNGHGCALGAALCCRGGLSTASHGSTVTRGLSALEQLLELCSLTPPMNEANMTVSEYRPLTEALDEVERELNVRSRCFPRWVQDGRVSRTDAKDRLDRLATALRSLELLRDAPEGMTARDLRADVAALETAEPAAKPF